MTNFAAMAELKAKFLECASHSYVLMDASKVGAPGLLRFGGLDGIEAVVMDADPDGAVAADLDGTRTKLVLAGE
jgi:DeoR/GlpR family transcriptional regulator of sugar metabolism